MNVGIVGAGPWGRALASLAEAAGCSVHLAGRQDPLPAVAEHAELILVATPSVALRAVLGGLRPGPEHRIVLASRGLDPETGGWLSDVVRLNTPCLRVGTLAGPAVASDVEASQPCAVVVASRYDQVCALVQTALHSSRLRVYPSPDLEGVQIAAAMVPILVAAVGLADAAELGAGARGLVVARGLAEARRLAEAMGADPATLFGLAGLGDLVSAISRPDHPAWLLGCQLARGEADPESETLHTASAALLQAQRLGIELPITAAVRGVGQKDIDVREAVRGLMARAARPGEH